MRLSTDIPTQPLDKDQMLARVPRITYRQLNVWTTKGYLHAEPQTRKGKGVPMRWLAGEDRVAQLMVDLILGGFEVSRAAGFARHIVNGHRAFDVVATPELHVTMTITIRTDTPDASLPA